MTSAIGQASAASTEVGEVTDTAAAAAAGGATAVRETVAGMSEIKSVVADAAEQGRASWAAGREDRGGGRDDRRHRRADQPAGPERRDRGGPGWRARAGLRGGRGRGPQAGRALRRETKAIADLIARSRPGREQAVEAMTVGSSEVEAGTTLAARSGAALDEIAAAVSATKARGEPDHDRGRGDVGRELGRRRRDRRDRPDRRGDQRRGIVDDRGGRHGDPLGRVDRRGVSQENSAAAEEVSAATEELSAQSDQVVGSAQQLAAMAAQLDGLVARFKLAGNGAAKPATVVQRRRESDWKAA